MLSQGSLSFSRLGLYLHQKPLNSKLKFGSPSCFGLLYHAQLVVHLPQRHLGQGCYASKSQKNASKRFSTWTAARVRNRIRSRTKSIFSWTGADFLAWIISIFSKECPECEEQREPHRDTDDRAMERGWFVPITKRRYEARWT